MTVEIKDCDLKHAVTFGSQHIDVKCVAKITGEGLSDDVDAECYNITYYRDPISGRLVSVIMEENDNASNTLDIQEVKELIEDHLAI